MLARIASDCNYAVLVIICGVANVYVCIWLEVFDRFVLFVKGIIRFVLSIPRGDSPYQYPVASSDNVTELRKMRDLPTAVVAKIRHRHVSVLLSNRS